MEIVTEYEESRTKKAQRKAILEAAYTLFLENGIEAVQMQDISAACGIQRRSVYNYYSKKEEIAIDLMKCWYRAFSEQMVPQSEQHGANGFERLKNSLHDFAQQLTAQAEMLRYSVHFDHYFRKDYGDGTFSEYVHRFFATLHDVSYFEQGLADGSINKAYANDAAATLQTMYAAILAPAQRVTFRPQQLAEEGGTQERSVQILIDLLLAAVRA